MDERLNKLIEEVAAVIREKWGEKACAGITIDDTGYIGITVTEWEKSPVSVETRKRRELFDVWKDSKEGWREDRSKDQNAHYSKLGLLLEKEAV